MGIKLLLYILIGIVVLLIVSCKKQHTSNPELSTVERLLDIYPDSALFLLNRISSPDSLSENNIAQYCMLAGKIADKLETNELPPAKYFDKAFIWYKKHGNLEAQVQIKLYLGRSYFEEEKYDDAMSTYIDALQSAKENEMYNLAGYICTYIADSFDYNDMPEEAIKYNENAGSFFFKVNNIKSYIYSLKNLAREWYGIDSTNYSLKYLQKADSIAWKLNDKEVMSVIENAFGNIYYDLKKFDEAERHFLKSSTLDTTALLHNNFALVDLYINSGKLQKARATLKQIQTDNLLYQYAIKEAYYHIYKLEKNYPDALYSLEKCKYISDSVSLVQNRSRIVEIERKYNNVKLTEKVDKLTINQQRYFMLFIVSILVVILTIFLYYFYRQRIREKLILQKSELDAKKIELLNTSIDLDKKKLQLTQMIALNKSNIKETKLLQTKIEKISNQYQKLQKKRITSSPIYKKITELTKHKVPRTKKILTEQLWESIVTECMDVYPCLKLYIINLSPDLSEQDWRYCCLCMFNFDSNIEAELLGISPNSVSKKRLRLRHRLGLELLPTISLYEHLVKNINP